MRKYIKLKLIVIAAMPCVIFYSCQKTIDTPAHEGAVYSANVRVVPYQFERINERNFFSQGWKEQQVNIDGTTTTFSDLSDLVEIVCGPDNASDPRLNRGCITMNLPTGGDPTLRRIRLRRGGYSGTLLADLTELRYSTYVVQNAATIMVLQIDVNGDEVKDFNIFYEPRLQPPGFQQVQLNTWQQWDALNRAVWYIEVAQVSLPGNLADLECTIPEIVAAFPNARIIDTPPMGHNGEGVRFTIGGSPRNLYDNTIGFFDALIIGTKGQQHSTLYDFMCNQSPD